MSSIPRRPFYTEFAWAFDLLIDRPVRKETGAIVAWLTERGVLPGARVLDAGCGTGRYAHELARRGYAVHGIDAAPELIAVAMRAGVEARSTPSFEIGDIGALYKGHYDAILCRGVLNDIIDDGDRCAVLASFARALRPQGVLILDARDWNGTAARKSREAVFRKSVDTERGRLRFESVTELDPSTRRMLISERHTLHGPAGEYSRDYEFVMRCATRDELQSQLSAAGFTSIDWFGAYDPAIPPGSTDRLVVVAVA